MNGKKISVYIGKEQAQALEDRSSPVRTKSPVLTEIIARYDELCRRALPDWPFEVWEHLTIRLREWKPSEAGLIRESVLLELEKVKDKSIEDSECWHRFAQLSYPQAVGVIDTIEKFWAAQERGEVSALPGAGRKQEFR